jgi:hypothetical protein
LPFWWKAGGPGALAGIILWKKMLMTKVQADNPIVIRKF